MEIILSLFPELEPMFRGFWVFFSNGGFLLFFGLIIWLLYLVYMNEIVGNWKASQKFTFLSIKMPRENLVSTLAVEQIYAQLHAAHRSMTMAEKYLEGRVQLWFSFEIVSMGGKISYIMRVPHKFQDTAEAAIYAQYPDAEITVINDYLDNFEFHPGHSDYEMFGTEFKLKESDVFPIKTYRDLEHTSAEIKIIDPTAPLMEGMSKIDPDEFIGIQIIAQPLGDDEWHGKAQKKAKKLLGEEVHESHGWFDTIVDAINPLEFIKLLLGMKGGGHGHAEPKAQKNDLLSMTEIEKEQVNAIQTKATKPGYLCKIRMMYLSPKEKFDRSRRALIVGAFRTLSKTHGNSLKPDSKHVSTRAKYRISKSLEGPYLEWLMERRKHHFIEGWKGRSYYIGLPQFILNTEELATLFHLPMSLPSVAADVARIESKKSQAPVNLPVGNF